MHKPLGICNECGKSSLRIQQLNSPSGRRLSEAFAKSESNRSVPNLGIVASRIGLFPDRLDHCFNSALFVLVFDPRRKGPRRYATAEVLFIIKKGLRFAAIKISGCAIRFMRRAGAVDMIQFPLNLDSLSHSGLEKVIII